jgi:superfamily II DNA/RNA helicase
MFQDKEEEKKEGEQEQEHGYATITDWEDLDIEINLFRGIFLMGFDKPSPIQQKAIVPILHKRDVIAQAQSGTGKTAAFSIGALSLVDTSQNNTQILILSPTKELAAQTFDVLCAIGKLIQPPVVHLMLFGGSSEQTTSNDASLLPHVICGCPGKVFDWLKRKRIDASTMKLLVLDEADEMLASGLNEQVYNIFAFLPKEVQVALFSATLPPSVQSTIQKIMRDPVSIRVKCEELTLEGIAQYYLPAENDNRKYEIIKNLFSSLTVSQSIIYLNSVDRVEQLFFKMQKDKFPVTMLHSNMERKERDLAFRDFKNGASRVLISSNVTARGIDIQQVNIVINFDIPKDTSMYLHRIGRSGRWGRKGTAINIVTEGDVNKMKEIERLYGLNIQQLQDFNTLKEN